MILPNSTPQLTDEAIATLLAGVPFGLIIVGAENNIIAINDTASPLIGLEPGDAAGLSVVDLLADPGESPLLDDTIRSAREGESVQRSFQVRARGVLRGLDFRCWPQESADGPLVFAMIEVSAAHDQARQIRDLIARSPSGMARLVGSTTMTDVNQRWTDITGQPAAEASGEGWLERIDPTVARSSSMP